MRADIRLPRASSGNEALDRFLNGGYEQAVITTVYGPAGSGKTNLMLIAMASVALSGKRVLYLDTEANVSVDRLRQITPKAEDVLDKALFLHLSTFEEQHNAIMQLPDKVTKEIGLVIVDSIGALYRLEMGREQASDVNKRFGLQMGKLAELAMRASIPILATDQVYSSFDDRDAVQVVGGDIIRYGSKALLELKKEKAGARAMIVKKHRSLPEGIEFRFRITGAGITPL